MSSRISQMRNEQLQPQQPQSQLNQSIEQVRGLMAQLKTMQNPQQAIANLIAGNPQMKQLIQSGMSMETIARQLAASKGIDINQLINQLQGGV